MIATGFLPVALQKCLKPATVRLCNCACVCVRVCVVVGVAHKFQLNAQEARIGHTPMRQTEAGQGLRLATELRVRQGNRPLHKLIHQLLTPSPLLIHTHTTAASTAGHTLNKKLAF